MTPRPDAPEGTGSTAVSGPSPATGPRQRRKVQWSGVRQPRGLHGSRTILARMFIQQAVLSAIFGLGLLVAVPALVLASGAKCRRPGVS
jgi:hypothetical protein